MAQQEPNRALIGTLAHEFPDYPADTLPAIPAWLTAAHWHNNSCPSWRHETADRREVMLYVDHPDRAQREVPDFNRFIVGVSPVDASFVAEDALSTDDWPTALAFLIALRWVGRFGLGFHPDTRGASYVEHADGRRCLSDAEAAEYDRDIETLFRAAGDPYQHGINAMKAMGLLRPGEG